MSTVAFLEHLKIRGYSDRTIEAYDRDLREYFNALPLLSESKDAVKHWFESLQGKPNSVNRKLNAVKSYYNFCVKAGLMDINPASNIRVKKVKRSLPKFIPNLGTLLSDKEMDTLDRAVIQTLWETGLRVAELATLTKANLNSDYIRVLGKGNKERLIPIQPELYAMLSELNAEGETVFGLEIHQIQYIVKKHLGVFPHTIRHTFATDLINAGANIFVIQKMLGHSSPETTERYTHINYERLKKVHEQCFPKRIAS